MVGKWFAQSPTFRRARQPHREIGGLPRVRRCKSDQGPRQTQAIGKLGGTIYQLANAQVMSDKFIPSSVLAQLRRDAVIALDRAQRITFKRQLRLPEQADAPCFAKNLTYTDNVANHLSRQVYEAHGAESIEPALECEMPDGTPTVMHTRYCIRRELGACKSRKAANNCPTNSSCVQATAF